MGRVDVDAMLDELTPAQLDEWLAYDAIAPFGDERADLRQGLAAAALCQAWGADLTLRHFMPFTDWPDEDDFRAESDELIEAKLEQIFLMHNAAVSP